MISSSFSVGMVGVLGVFYVLVGWWGFSWQHKHILSGLLCIEVALVGALMSFMAVGFGGLTYIVFVILSLGVCESALGLSLLVVYARYYGNDLFRGLDGQGY